MSLEALTKLHAAISAVRKEAPNLPTQQLHVLLTIALNEGLTQVKIQELCGMTTPAASRNVRALKEFAEEGRQGLNWVTSEQDKINKRDQLLYLTTEGRRILRRLLKPLR